MAVSPCLLCGGGAKPPRLWALLHLVRSDAARYSVCCSELIPRNYEARLWGGS